MNEPNLNSRPRHGRSILYVTTVASTALAFLAPYSRALRKEGWRVEIATNVGDSAADLSTAFDAVHHVPTSRSLRDVAGLLGASRAMAGAVSSGFDIVHVHTPIAAFICRLAIARMPRTSRPSVVYTAHGFHFHRAGHSVANWMFVLAERVMGRWTDRLIVINRDDYDAARRFRIVPGTRLLHLPGIGIDTDFYSRIRSGPDDHDSALLALDIPPEAESFVFVGDLNRNKRPTDAVAALARIGSSAPHLVFVGDGSERATTLALAARLGVAHRVHVTGFVDDVRPYVASATALILPSRREGLARSIMEALSLEVPVIASTARGNAELVEGDGIVFATGDVVALAGAMRWMVHHPAEAREMGRRGRARMSERYELSLLVRRHQDLYDEMLG